METHGGIIVSLENTNFGRPRYERVFQPVKGSQRLFGVRGFAMRHAPRSQVVSEASNDPLVLPPKDQTKRRKKRQNQMVGVPLVSDSRQKFHQRRVLSCFSKWWTRVGWFYRETSKKQASSGRPKSQIE